MTTEKKPADTIREALLLADSELSAYANHRPLTKQDAQKASDKCRAALALLDKARILHGSAANLGEQAPSYLVIPLEAL